MPGRLLHRIAQRLCPADTDRVIEPLLADLQREWNDAPPGAGRTIALARGYAAFWQTCAWCGIRFVAAETLRPPAREVRSIALAAFTVAALVVILMQALAVIWHPRVAADQMPLVFWWIVLNTATTTMPLALLPVCLLARNREARTGDAVKLAIVGALVTAATSGWVAPWAERHHVATVLAHGGQVATATAARPGHQRDAWAVVPANRSARSSHAGTRSVEEVVVVGAIGGATTLALAVAWLGWTIARPRQQGLPTVLGWWVVVYALLNVHAVSEPVFQIWQRAMILVIMTVGVRLAQRSY